MRCYAQHAGRIAVVITDVQMPGINGREFVEWLHRQGKRVPVIMMSGGTGDLEIGSLLRRAELAWLTKPFDIEELVEALDHVVGKSHES